MYVKPLFSVEPSDDQAESDEKSEKKQARRSKQERGNNTRDEKVATVSDEVYQSRLSRKESPPQRRGGGEDMEALKQKKIEEIRNKLISERASQGIQPYKQNRKVEEEVKPTVVSHKYNSREPVERSANSKEIKGH
jgi:hypothetical protein